MGLALSAMTMLGAARAEAQTYTTLHLFNGFDGAGSAGAPVLDAAGTLFGTTAQGGASDNGTVYLFNTKTATLRTIHSFSYNTDGATPYGALVFDAGSNLYGTTSRGGSDGYGTVYKISPTTDLLTPLYNFTGGADGSTPSAGLVFDTNGMLYGTTTGGGTSHAGTVFKLDPNTKTYTLLHTFTGGTDGSYPDARLTFDGKSTLYGTARLGTAVNCGTIFKINIATGAFTTLHAFTCGDGAAPAGELVMDSKGALYGTALYGGSYGYGVVFKWDPATSKLTKLASMIGGTHGSYPAGGLAFSPSGELYGTTSRLNLYGLWHGVQDERYLRRQFGGASFYTDDRRRFAASLDHLQPQGHDLWHDLDRRAEWLRVDFPDCVLRRLGLCPNPPGAGRPLDPNKMGRGPTAPRPILLGSRAASWPF